MKNKKLLFGGIASGLLLIVVFMIPIIFSSGTPLTSVQKAYKIYDSDASREIFCQGSKDPYECEKDPNVQLLSTALGICSTDKINQKTLMDMALPRNNKHRKNTAAKGSKIIKNCYERIVVKKDDVLGKRAFVVNKFYEALTKDLCAKTENPKECMSPHPFMNDTARMIQIRSLAFALCLDSKDYIKAKDNKKEKIFNECDHEVLEELKAEID